MIPKFRAWDKQKKHFIDDFEIDMEGTIFVRNFYCGSYYDTDFPVAELMQSTGLTDKNGVEIFEGDVVSLSGSLYTIIYDAENGAYKMISHDERWIDDYILSYITTESLTVVGNKFEGVKE